MNEYNLNSTVDLLPEVRLIREAREGSKEAFCKLYGLYKDKLYRYALYKLGNPSDAEDAVSDCVLAAWKGIRSLRSENAFGSWLFRIMNNTCSKMIRREITAREGLEAAGRSMQASHQSSTEMQVELVDILSRLSDEEREIVLLSVVSGLTSNEVSEITGLKPATVRSKLSRSLAKMRSYLG